MTALIRTEWLKMRKYNAFWWIMGITAISYPGINYVYYMIYDSTINNETLGATAKVFIGEPYTFPEVWHTVAYASSTFIFIPAIVIIMFITNEYSFKTHRQNIIDGWSRNEFITSKLLDVAMITALITVLYTGVAFITGLLNSKQVPGNFWSQSYYVGLFALQTFSQLSIAFFAGFLIRKAFIALGVFYFYFILENIIVAILRYYKNPARHYLPMEISDNLIPVPTFFGRLDTAAYDASLKAIPLHVLLTIVFTTVLWVICYRINKQRDLK